MLLWKRKDKQRLDLRAAWFGEENVYDAHFLNENEWTKIVCVIKQKS